MPPGAITYTVQEAAEVLGISDRQVYRLVAEGRLPKLEGIGQLTRIPRGAVDALVDNALRRAPWVPGTP